MPTRRPNPWLRRLVALAAVVVVLAVLGLAHYYVALRLVLEPALGEPLRSLALGALSVLAVSLVALPLAERALPPRRLRPLAWVPLLWMGAAFLLLVQLGVSDAALWLMGAAASGPEQAEAALRVRAAAVVGLTVLVTGLAVRTALAGPIIQRIEVPLAGLAPALDGFRIAQISDVHIGPLLDRRFAQAVTAQVNALAPDLIAITGDLVDGRVEHLADEVAPFGGLRATHGVFFVTGNHDYYSGADPWIEVLEGLGIEPLRNRLVSVAVGEGGARFDLAGVEDHRGDWVHGSPEDLDAALADRDVAQPVVLLAHDPSTFVEAARRGVDLQLSGHTHGGQIWPFRHLVRLAVPFVEGLHRVGASQLYVSRGTGFWGPPMRLFAPSEITEITLRAAPARAAAEAA